MASTRHLLSSKWLALVWLMWLRSATSQPALLSRHSAVSELGSIRDRLSRHDARVTPGWGLDWSRRIQPAGPGASVPSQHHVSHASNSYGTIPSASTTSLLYSRPRQRQAVQRRFLRGYRQPLNPYLLPSKRPSPVVQFGRFETSPSSSTSNGDTLPEFAYHLNKVATHRRRAESMMPIQTVYGTRVDNTPFVSEDDILAPDDIRPDVVRPHPAPEMIAGAVQVVREEGDDYPDIIVKSTLGLAPALQVDASSNENYLPDYSDSPGQNTDLAHEDESINDVETDKELYSFRNYRGEGIPYEQILLDNAIDLGKLMKSKENENMIVQDVLEEEEEEEDTGKSLGNITPSLSRRVQLITDSSVSPVIEDNHKVIYLKMVQPDSRSRLKGSKLKEVQESSDEDLLDESSFDSYLSGDMKNTRTTDGHKVGPSDPFEFDLIENQIAAVNRIGDVASSESTESAQVVKSKLVAGGPRARLNEENSLASNTTMAKASQDLVDGAGIKGKQELRNFDDVEQRSNFTPNQNKQLTDYYPQPPSDVYNQDSTGTGYNQGAAIGTGASSGGTSTTTSRPFKQRYPGWANVEPYQYSQRDQKTGAYKFGYGDPYQWRHEERRADGVVFGGYGWLDEAGKHHIIRFVADRLGYRVLPRDQQIDFSEVPVYPPLKEPEDNQSAGSPSQGYDKIEFVTPEPLRPADLGGYPGVTSAPVDQPEVPDWNVPQVHPPVAYPGSILQLLGSSSGAQLTNVSFEGNSSRPGIALNFPSSPDETSTIPTSILESLLKEQAKQSYQGRSQTDESELSEQGGDSPLTERSEGGSESGNTDTLSQFASTIELLQPSNTSSESRPPFNTASNSIAVPAVYREAGQDKDSQ